MLVWAAFSVAATAMQWGLQNAALLSPMMVATSTILGGVLFVVSRRLSVDAAQVRLPQALPLSHGLHHGALAAGPGWARFRMGLGHGAFCLGCCGFVMGLLFVGGVMNLAWVAAITVFVVAEKLMPRGEWVARAGGVAMIAAGVYFFTAL